MNVDVMIRLWARDLRHGVAPRSLLLAIAAWVQIEGRDD